MSRGCRARCRAALSTTPMVGSRSWARNGAPCRWCLLFTYCYSLTNLYQFRNILSKLFNLHVVFTWMLFYLTLSCSNILLKRELSLKNNLTLMEVCFCFVCRCCSFCQSAVCIDILDGVTHRYIGVSLTFKYMAQIINSILCYYNVLNNC